MDIKNLPLVLFREFSIATLEQTEHRITGESGEGLGLLVLKTAQPFEVVELSLHRTPQHIPDDMPLVTIEAGTFCTNETRASIEKIEERSRIKFPIGHERKLNLTKPHTAMIARFFSRAVELAQSGAYELGWFWYDWKTQKRVASPYSDTTRG